MSRQGLSKHLAKLLQAELLVVEYRGREKIFKANKAPLSGAISWMQNLPAKEKESANQQREIHLENERNMFSFLMEQNKI